MRNKTERILNFIQGGASLQEVRSKAIIKLTNEIQGFGSSSSSTSSSSSSPTHSWRSSSFDNNSPSSPTWHHDHHHHHPSHDHIKHGDHMKQLDLEENLLEPNNCPKNDEVIFQHNRMPKNFLDDGVTTSDILDWNSFQETFIEIDLNDDFEDHDNNNDKKKVGFFKGICSKHVGYKPIE
ncbi:hypothetical protein BVRB_3g048830 [Beta vulgaris subsp. vulgaris]|nr:hypothetical protein BVRB_3g048830 [Beta vulgaris subsp. vulgaris]